MKAPIRALLTNTVSSHLRLRADTDINENTAETEVEVHTDAEDICTTCEAFNYVNDVLTAVYVIELLVNLYGHWPSSREPFFAQPSFFTDPWCLFDFAGELLCDERYGTVVVSRALPTNTVHQHLR